MFNRNQISKITLGTAQLGMSYGIANKTGQPVFRSTVELVRVDLQIPPWGFHEPTAYLGRWSGWTGSNRRPPRPARGALPAALHPDGSHSNDASSPGQGAPIYPCFERRRRHPRYGGAGPKGYTTTIAELHTVSNMRRVTV